MMKYIDADKLIAEIERRKEKWLAESRLIKKGKDKAMYAAGKSSAYTEFFSYLTSLQQEQPEVDLEEEAYMRGFAQGAKEERESLSPIMLTYAADVFSGKMLLEDISYSYRQELADYFRDLAKMAKATNARKEESK